MTRAELEALPAAVLDEAVDDLTALSSVHDATMLDTLRRRHAADEIFTSIGEVVISVNPFKPVPSCTPDSIARLSQQGEAAPPHVARVASVAYRKMTGDDGSPPRAQSILISGESGAGKTEACKLCLMALASVSGSSQGATEGAVESALLLEAFGNAKTVYNDNSSRFGKWTAVFFDASRRIVACHAEAFLLEKPRVVGTGPGERSYHIFYQMLAGANEEERRELSLQSSCSAYAYLRGGTDAISGVDDAAQWRETAARMSLLGIGGERRGELMRVIAAVLAIGNIGFTAADDGTRCVSGEGGRWLAHAASLLRVSPSQLAEKLTSRVLTAGGKGRSSMYTVALDAEACEAARDALAQSLYAAAFESLVESLNGSQEEAAAAAGRVRGCATVDNERFVGLLDIFGFENFALNSFEQLCINFANERLQAHFIDALVKLRVLEYEREGVPLTAIDSLPSSPQAQLALLDGKAVGLFASLDDEGSVPGGSEQGYVDGLVARFGSNGACASEAFDPLKRGKGSRLDRLSFCVVHFAEPVRYSAEGWLAKNVSGLHPDLAFVLNQSESPLVRGMYPSSTADATAKRPSVGAAFRKSLRSLSTVMLQTTQSFLRCVKPNGHKAADTFDGRFVMRQLRYTGVAAVVAIQRAGYPVSMAHADFVGRYRCL
ncbi:hypothetical protein EMIHUDRAFT_68202, partial [Emiliania huxleyi CCMP1516]|uniref:Myosin motor domain-containing protein n=2 Tax=Emiliania huxleyi TaxID=2903 RepID=A0A0D3IAN5_EMIH1